MRDRPVRSAGCRQARRAGRGGTAPTPRGVRVRPAIAQARCFQDSGSKSQTAAWPSTEVISSCRPSADRSSAVLPAPPLGSSRPIWVPVATSQRDAVGSMPETASILPVGGELERERSRAAHVELVQERLGRDVPDADVVAEAPDREQAAVGAQRDGLGEEPAQGARAGDCLAPGDVPHRCAPGIDLGGRDEGPVGADGHVAVGLPRALRGGRPGRRLRCPRAPRPKRPVDRERRSVRDEAHAHDAPVGGAARAITAQGAATAIRRPRGSRWPSRVAAASVRPSGEKARDMTSPSGAGERRPDLLERARVEEREALALEADRDQLAVGAEPARMGVVRGRPEPGRS